MWSSEKKRGVPRAESRSADGGGTEDGRRGTVDISFSEILARIFLFSSAWWARLSRLTAASVGPIVPLQRSPSPSSLPRTTHLVVQEKKAVTINTNVNINPGRLRHRSAPRAANDVFHHADDWRSSSSESIHRDVFLRQ